LNNSAVEAVKIDDVREAAFNVIEMYEGVLLDGTRLLASGVPLIT
jgi:hypothetical protein